MRRHETAARERMHNLHVDGPLAAEVGSDVTGVVGFGFGCIWSLDVRLMVPEQRELRL